jgi:hypothetical protein
MSDPVTQPQQPGMEPVIALIRAIRPEWSQIAIATALTVVGTRPWQDRLRAIVALAVDPDTHSPGRLNQPGPWWPASPTTQPPRGQWREGMPPRDPDVNARGLELARAEIAARRSAQSQPEVVAP